MSNGDCCDYCGWTYYPFLRYAFHNWSLQLFMVIIFVSAQVMTYQEGSPSKS